MADETNSGEAQRRLLELLLAQTGTYHNHKETMAHAGVLVQIAVLAGMLSLKNWPPPWVPDVRVSSSLLAGLVFVLLWLLIHVFIRWELRKRRAAAIICAALVKTLRKWANTPPTHNDLKPFKPESTTGGALPRFLDYVFPNRCATLHYDVDKADYPTDFGKAWQDQEKIRTEATCGEWLLWIGSVLILALGFLRPFKGV